MSKRWNYLVTEVDPSWLGAVKTQKVQEELNRQGALGWELVNIVISHAGMAPSVLVFKKEI